MRALIGGVLVVAATMAAVVAFVIADSSRPEDSFGPPPPRPSSDAEKRAARVAVAFAERLRANDARGACALLAGPPARRFRCSSAPRIPRVHRLEPDEPIDARYAPGARTRGATAIGIPVRNGGPVMQVEVDRAGRVVHLTGYGYA